MDRELLPRRVLVSYAAPGAFAPVTRPMLARLGYAILTPEQYAAVAEEDDQPDLYLADERSLLEVPEDEPGTRVVALTGQHGVSGADPRIVGAIRRPAGLHDLFRILQQVLEEKPRSMPRVPTHLPSRCEHQDAEWRGTILSLSENGCLLRSPEPLSLGARFWLGFDLPRLGQVRVQGEVAYQLLPDLGVVFAAPSRRERETIGSYVREALTGR